MASFPYARIAAPVMASERDLFTSACGMCIELACVGPAAPASPAPAGDFCSTSTVVVQVTDACPCVHVQNLDSNERNCCGDADHFDLSVEAFSALAPLSLGIIASAYRRVACDVLAPPPPATPLATADVSGATSLRGR